MRTIENKQKSAIWAAAQENGIDKQNVYDIIFAVSGQERMTALTYMQAAQVLGRIRGQVLPERKQQRTDEGGTESTISLRRKIYKLTGELGWNDNNERIEGFVKRMFGKKAELKELEAWQCCKLIEILKGYVERGG